MGQTRIRVGDYEARIKDNVASPAGWHLWISLWKDGEMVANTGNVEPVIIADIDDETLEAAGRAFIGGYLAFVELAQAMYDDAKQIMRDHLEAEAKTFTNEEWAAYHFAGPGGVNAEIFPGLARFERELGEAPA
jgi:hypothetical protein